MTDRQFESFERRDFDTASTDGRAGKLAQKLRRSLPLAAQGRPVLMAALQRRFPCAKLMARLTVTDVFYAGEENGLMCRVDVQGLTGEPIVVVAPAAQLAFNRRHPIARDIAVMVKSREKRLHN